MHSALSCGLNLNPENGRVYELSDYRGELLKRRPGFCVGETASVIPGEERREKEHLRGLTKEKEQRLMIDNIYWIYISK